MLTVRVHVSFSSSNYNKWRELFRFGESKAKQNKSLRLLSGLNAIYLYISHFFRFNAFILPIDGGAYRSDAALCSKFQPSLIFVRQTDSNADRNKEMFNQLKYPKAKIGNTKIDPWSITIRRNHHQYKHNKRKNLDNAKTKLKYCPLMQQVVSEMRLRRNNLTTILRD